MSSVNGEAAPHRRRTVVLLSLGLTLGALTAVACSTQSATEKMKKVLSEHGSIDAEWEIRDDEEQKTYTYVLLRNTTGTHETYELIATDNQQTVHREQVGGIDANGCFLVDEGLTTRWIERKPDALEKTTKSGTKTRTACLEYQDTPAWMFVPEEDRKAAEPPPPPPPEVDDGPDAGVSDGDAGDVESALPL